MAAIDLSAVPVLVVDDHEDDVDLFAEILECSGAIVQRATTLLDALASYDRVKARVVVTDLAMPGGSGWDLLAQVRQRDCLLPVVAVTGRLLPGAPWLIKRGFDAVLYKPVDPGELVAVVKQLSRALFGVAVLFLTGGSLHAIP